MTLDNCAAVITGASAGIGRELARQLAARAKLLVLVARRRDRLEELRVELQTKNPALRLEIRDIDLANLEQTTRLAALLANEPIDFLINNAGLGDHGPFATADPTRVNQQIQVNVLALTALTRTLLPRMIAQKRGAILERQFLRWISPSPGHCSLRGHKSIRHQFFRSDPRRDTRLRDYRDRALPRPGPHRIRRGRESTGASTKAAGQFRPCAS
jgi:Short-chain dehydrogenases of various substrate specificities